MMTACSKAKSQHNYIVVGMRFDEFYPTEATSCLPGCREIVALPQVNFARAWSLLPQQNGSSRLLIWQGGIHFSSSGGFSSQQKKPDTRIKRSDQVKMIKFENLNLTIIRELNA
uniref:Uncharacterized protein n=1 Tax=Romanomermis culicivorax TaxID=13658 RepID=A0A915JLE9_ROMCU